MTEGSMKQCPVFIPEINDKMRSYLEFMLEYNKNVNLTSITTWDEAVVKHLHDALAIQTWEQWNEVKTVVDLGTGPGIPGIPLAIASPEKKIYLLETNGKKVKFLGEAIEHLELSNISIIHGRAEDYGMKKENREKVDLVVTRAVASLPVLLELAFPLIKVRGHLVAYKGPSPQEEIEKAQNAQTTLFANEPKIILYQLDQNYGARSLICYEKRLNTPAKYPRRPGIPEKNPI